MSIIKESVSIEPNKVASIHYRLFEEGSEELLDESSEPLEFLVGKKNIIKGLEEQLVGLNIGDEKEIIVIPEDAYGLYNEDSLEEVPMEQFAGIELKEGMTIYAHGENNSPVPVTIKSFNEEQAIVDYNHPLAGKTLKFFVSVAGVRDATASELLEGFPEQPKGGCCSGGGCGCG